MRISIEQAVNKLDSPGKLVNGGEGYSLPVYRVDLIKFCWLLIELGDFCLKIP